MSGIGSRFDVRGSMLEVEWIFSVLFRVSVAFLFDEIQKLCGLSVSLCIRDFFYGTQRAKNSLRFDVRSSRLNEFFSVLFRAFVAFLFFSLLKFSFYSD